MTAAGVSTADRAGQPGPLESGVRWAAVDWCARWRPAIWLDAAGPAIEAEQVRRHRAVDGAAALDALWPAVSAGAAAALVARQSGWADLADAVGALGDAPVAGVLPTMASVAWPSAIAAAGHLAAPAAQAAGLPDPGRVVFRTFTIPNTPGVGWDQAWDVARDAACIATCRALRGLVVTTAFQAAEPRRLMADMLESALAPVRAELSRSAAGWMEPMEPGP